jgi:hypothetical protein
LNPQCGEFGNLKKKKGMSTRHYCKNNFYNSKFEIGRPTKHKKTW